MKMIGFSARSGKVTALQERTTPEWSIVIPVHNEADNIAPLYQELFALAARLPLAVEFVFVDDASRDETRAVLERLLHQDERMRVICFEKRRGQSAALAAGIRASRGEWIATLDGDGQNDPADLKDFWSLAQREGAEMVVGWRRHRQDVFLAKKLPSLIVNRMFRFLLGSPVHDTGCTLKLMRSELARRLPLPNGFHRFLPALAHRLGAKVRERQVGHRARTRGESKYGWERLGPVLRDLVLISCLRLPGDRHRRWLLPVGLTAVLRVLFDAPLWAALFWGLMIPYVGHLIAMLRIRGTEVDEGSELRRTSTLAGDV